MTKTVLLIVIAMIFAGALIAQDSDALSLEQSRNEIKINGLYLIVGLPEISYERLINSESSFGASIGFAVDPDIDINFYFLPYYRIYFGKKHAAGFFLEGNGILISEESFEDFGTNSSNELGAGVGISVGGKFLTDTGLIGEVVLGVSRNFNGSSNTVAFPRIGIMLGKRF